MAKLQTREPNWNDKILYSWLLRKYFDNARLGNCIGSGGIANVYSLNGTEPPEVIKIVDLRLIQPEYRDEIFKRSHYEITHAPALGKASKYIMPITDAKQVPIPPFMLRDASTTDTLFMLRMPRLQKLNDIINKDFDETKLIRLGMHICQALQVCYDKEIFHRDVKPENIFVRYVNGNEQFVLGDFGIARDMEGGQLTEVGTDLFRAPETCSGHCSKNADIYSLGVTLYVVSGGSRAVSSGNFPEIAPGSRVAWDDFKRRKLVSPELQEVICRALKRVDERYQSPNEMYRDLARILNRGNGNHTRADAVRKLPPTPVDYAEAAKRELVLGQFSEAIRYAQEGYDRKDLHCGCLLAYCCYHQARLGHLSEEYRTHAENTLISLLEEVELEILEGKSAYDSLRATILCLLATIRYEQNRLQEYSELIRKAAENNCPMAQYLYGRSLFSGTVPFQINKSLGMLFLQKAAGADYSDALLFLREQRQKNPLLPISPELKQLIDNAGPLDHSRHRRDVIRYL